MIIRLSKRLLYLTKGFELFLNNFKRCCQTMTTDDARILTELYPLLLAMVPEDTPMLLLFIIVDCCDFVLFVYCCPLPLLLLVSIMFPLEP